MTTKHHLTMIDEAELRLKDVHMPAYYLNYQHNILKNVQVFYFRDQPKRRQHSQLLKR